MRMCIVFVITLLCWLDTGKGQTAEASPGSQDGRLLVRAGAHYRADVPMSVLLGAPSARSAYVQYEDGSCGRAGVVQPGVQYTAAQADNKVEVFFGIDDPRKGQVQKVVVKLSDDPVTDRHYVWSGEPQGSRRLSCAVPSGFVTSQRSLSGTRTRGAEDHRQTISFPEVRAFADLERQGLPMA